MRFQTLLRGVVLLLIVTALAAKPVTADNPSLPALRPATPLTADELAQLLGAYVWKVGVAVPADATEFDIGLSLKKKGQIAQNFGIGMSGPIHKDTKRELLIAIIPVNGTLDDTEKVRVEISGFDISAGSTVDNPFRKLSIGRTGAPEDNKDGTFNLIGGYEGSTVSTPLSASADKVLSLKIEMKK